MIRRTYGKVEGFDEERIPLEMARTLPERTMFSFTLDMPGTGIEKKVYNFLLKMGVRFQFQYNWMDSKLTDYRESGRVPDFILPDFNDTVIETYGQYWHSSLEDRKDDAVKKALAMMMGYVIIEKGIWTYPNSAPNGGKYVIWWEDEVNNNLDYIFRRDLPEVHSGFIKSEPDQFLGDEKNELEKMLAKNKARVIRRMVPKVPTYRTTAGLKLKGKGTKDIHRVADEPKWNSQARGKDVRY